MPVRTEKNGLSTNTFKNLNPSLFFFLFLHDSLVFIYQVESKLIPKIQKCFLLLRIHITSFTHINTYTQRGVSVYHWMQEIMFFRMHTRLVPKECCNPLKIQKNRSGHIQANMSLHNNNSVTSILDYRSSLSKHFIYVLIRMSVPPGPSRGALWFQVLYPHGCSNLLLKISKKWKMSLTPLYLQVLTSCMHN